MNDAGGARNDPEKGRHRSAPGRSATTPSLRRPARTRIAFARGCPGTPAAGCSMKRVSLAALLLCSACASIPKPDTNLDRVVVYRNGVAYFERSARVITPEITVHVRTSDVDDFLK